MSSIIKIIFSRNELKQVKDIAESLNIKFNTYNLKKISKDNVNAFEISDNLVYLYPSNDGMPTCEFEFYQNGNLIIDNESEYSQITNLDDIILQMVRLYNQALDKKIVLDPYCFMLELTEKVEKDYHGNANLVITDMAIKNQKLNEENFNKANKYFINHFLDHFIGWNFGVSINRNELLKQELEELNERVIDMGLREFAGFGIRVYGDADTECNGLQHYKLATEKTNVKKKVLK